MDLIIGTLIVLCIAFIINKIVNKKTTPENRPTTKPQKLEVIDIELLSNAARFKYDIEHLKQQYIANTDLLNLRTHIMWPVVYYLKS